MNFTDFCSKAEFDCMQNQIKEKHAFEHERTLKVKDGCVKLHLYGERITKDLADEIWNGENYIIGIDFSCMRTNNHSGSGGAYPMSELLAMQYSDFAKECEGWATNHVPNDYVFWNDYNEQLSLF